MTGIRSMVLLSGIVCSICIRLNAQAISPPLIAGSQIYVGSTPCDSFIHALLQIKSTSLCEFMKWELRLKRNKPDSFALVVYYGESKPNTNWFKKDGEKLELSGTFTVGRGNASNPKAKIYSLQSAKLKAPIQLIEMDPDILHFSDTKKNLLVGNAGFSYVLNRITP